MSTSSAYSSNKLKQVIENKTQHFVIKSFMTSSFEYNRKKPEYHLYWYNKNGGIDPETMRYRNMSNKKMNSKEVAFFKSILSEYDTEIDTKDGSVWKHNQIGFNKSMVVMNNYVLFS